MAATDWTVLDRGDYLREDYLHALCESRSPLKAWRETGETIKDDGLQQIEIIDPALKYYYAA